jgi:polyisoprenoid-binding protein YceI
MLRALLLTLLLLPTGAVAAPWRLSPETTIAVDVLWQGNPITLSFPTFSGEVDFDERRPQDASARIVVAASAVRTGAGPADALARSVDYLGAERYPTIVFDLDRLERTSSSTADIFGRITFRGVTRPLSFRAEVFRYGPAADDPERFEAGFTLSGTIDRTQFGSTGGLPYVSATLPIRIRLLMTSK